MGRPLEVDRAIHSTPRSVRGFTAGCRFPACRSVSVGRYPFPYRHHIYQVSYCKSSNKDARVFKAYTFEFSMCALPMFPCGYVVHVAHFNLLRPMFRSCGTMLPRKLPFLQVFSLYEALSLLAYRQACVFILCELRAYVVQISH
jgi:hypothetical protein